MKTTDNQDELFDIVDKDDQVIGQSTRGKLHRNKNLIHRSIGVCVFNSKGEIYLQKRSNTKDTDPGKWTISCSGHVLSGDSYQVTAARELKEELGVDLQIEFVVKYLCHASNETEMQMLFKAYSEGPFKLHPQEIEEGKFYTQDKLKVAIRRGEIELSFSGKMALKKIGWITH